VLKNVFREMLITGLMAGRVSALKSGFYERMLLLKSATEAYGSKKHANQSQKK